MRIFQKRTNNPMCALSPYVGIIIEEENFSMCFANDIYLITNKSKNRFASLVLVGFWCLLRYYGVILSSMFLKVKALKYCIREQNDSK
jgi:hypothetical protein